MRSRFAISSAAPFTIERSGSRCFDSGVGSAIRIASASRELVVVGRRAEPVVVDEPLQRLGGNVLDVALAAVQHRHALGVAVDEEHAAARLGEHLGERDTDVAGSDDGDVGHRRAIVQRRPVPRPTRP